MSISISKNFYDISIIPKNWTEKRLKNILSISENKSSKFNNEEILSLTRKGIVINDISSNKGQIAKSYEKYIKVKKGQICMNPMDLLSGWVDISYFEGLISPAYYTFELNKEVENKFINYFFQSNYLRKTFFKLGKGVASHDNFGRWVLTPDELKNIYIFIPNIKEQKLISSYLDKKTEQIDRMVEKFQKKIELLKEQRASLINQCVTKGIDPNVEMKDSGVELFGEIPKHWYIKKVKYLTIRNGFKSGPFGSTLITNQLSDFGDWIVYSPENLRLTNITNQLFVPEERKLELEKYLVKTDDILIPIVGSLNISMLITKDHPKGILNQRLCRLSLDNLKINIPLFSFMFINALIIKTQIDLEKKGSILDHITKEIIFNLMIPYAPRDEQNKIFDRLKSITKRYDLLVEKYFIKIRLLKEYRASLISSVVTGKLIITEDMV